MAEPDNFQAEYEKLEPKPKARAKRPSQAESKPKKAPPKNLTDREQN